MNWKVIVGVLIIFGSVKEFFNIGADYRNGVTNFNPLYGQLGSITLVGFGCYLIYKGRQKKE